MDIIFLLLIFILPFYKITVINIFNIGIGLPYIILIFLLLFLGLKFVYLGKFRLFSNIKPLILLWVIFVTWFFISILWTKEITTWAYQFIRTLANLSFFIFPIIFIQKRISFLNKTIKIYIATSVFFIIDTIIRIYNSVLLSGYSNIWFFYSKFKESGLVKDTNTVGIYVGLILTLIVYNLFKSNKNQRKYLGLLFICIFILFLTLSRGAIVAVVISWITGYIFLLKPILNKKIRRRVLGIILVIAIIFTVVIVGLRCLKNEKLLFLTDRYLNLSFFLEEAGFTNRVIIWDTAWSIFKESPILGGGIGGFFVHNLYLSILAKTGLIGFMLFSIWISSILLLLLKFSKKSLLARLGLIGMFSYLLEGLVMFDLTEAYFWLYISLILVGSNIEIEYKETNKINVL